MQAQTMSIGFAFGIDCKIVKRCESADRTHAETFIGIRGEHKYGYPKKKRTVLCDTVYYIHVFQNILIDMNINILDQLKK